MPSLRTIRIIIAIVVLGILGTTVLLWVHPTHQDPASISKECERTEDVRHCYEEAVKKTLERDGLPAALDLVAQIYPRSPAFAKFCHYSMHDLGKEAYALYRSSMHIDLTGNTASCGFGYYHGFLTELMIKTHDLGEARAFCAYAGSLDPSGGIGLEASCYHGIGHGVTDGTDASHWGDASAIAAPGLALCKEVALTEEWRGFCASGVFASVANMHTVPRYQLDPHGDPFAMCRKAGYAESEYRACYNQMNSLAMRMSSSTLERALAFTDSIPDMRNRAEAVSGVAAIYLQALKQRGRVLEPDVAVRACIALPEEVVTACISGLVGGIVEFGAPKRQHAGIIALCESSVHTAHTRKLCYEQLQSVLRASAEESEIPTICDQIPREYRIHTCTPDAAGVNR